MFKRGRFSSGMPLMEGSSPGEDRELGSDTSLVRSSDLPPLYVFSAGLDGFERTYTTRQVFARILAAFFGAGILLMPQHMVQLGLLVAPLVVALVMGLISYSGRCLDFSIDYVILHEGVEVSRMTELAKIAGGRWAECVCFLCNVGALTAYSLMNLILSGRTVNRLVNLVYGPLNWGGFSDLKVCLLVGFPFWYLLLRVGTSASSLLVLSKVSGVAAFLLISILILLAAAKLWRHPGPHPDFSVWPVAENFEELGQDFLNLALTSFFFCAFLVPLPGLRRNMVSPEKFVQTFSRALLVIIVAYVLAFVMGFYVMGRMPPESSLVDLVGPESPILLQVSTWVLFGLMTLSIELVFMHTVLLTLFKREHLLASEVFLFLLGLHATILCVDQIRLIIDVCAAPFCLSNCILIPGSIYGHFKWVSQKSQRQRMRNLPEFGFLLLVFGFGLALMAFGVKGALKPLIFDTPLPK